MVYVKVVLKFLILILLFIFPLSVYAETVESGYTSISSSIEGFSLGKIKFSNITYNRYDNYRSSGRKAVVITGNIYNSYSDIVDVESTLRLYDKDKVILSDFESHVEIGQNGNAMYRVVVYEDEQDYMLDDIKYYIVSSDMLNEISILEATQNDSYYFSDYNLKVDVNIDNVYSYKNEFVVNFKKNKDVVHVGIPIRHRYTRLDGSSVNKRAVISNIKVEQDYSSSIEQGIKMLHIGHEEKNVLNSKYSYSYDYNVGKDILDGNDEIFIYLVRDNEYRINDFDFEVTLPKNVKHEDIKVIDQNGIELENIIFTVNENVIKGKIDGAISPDSSYILNIMVPDDYFQNCTNNINGFIIMNVIISFTFMIITLIIWELKRRLKSNITCKNVLFSAEINSLELGYLLNSKVKESDIATLVIDLANKGYIEIIKLKNDYKIVKKKDYDLNDRVEYAFMSLFFSSKDEINGKEVIGALKNVKQTLEKKLEEHNKKRKIFSHKIFNCRLMFWIMVLIIVSLNVIGLLAEFQPSVIIVNIIFTGGGYLLLFNGVLNAQKPIEKMLYALVSIIMIISVILLTSYKAFTNDNLALISYIIGIICMLVLTVVANGYGNRTSYGNRMLYTIKAYKDYLINLEDVDKELEKNPSCYYQVIPNALVFGISDKWMNKFMDKTLEKPEWYKCDEFNNEEFYDDIKNVYSDIFLGLKNNESDE